MPVRRVVNIQLLKVFALEKLPHTSPLRDLILSEKDELAVSEFLAKLEDWIKLIKYSSKTLGSERHS